jgi:hypothetical protein
MKPNHKTQPVKRKTFVRIIKQRVEIEVKDRKRSKLQKISFIFGQTANFIFLIASLILVTFIWKERVFEVYISSPFAHGELILNDLTISSFFSSVLPFPPTGWMPFWNLGTPVIGNFPTTLFYLLSPLNHIFDPVFTIELILITSTLFFLLSSHILFYILSKNHPLSLFLTLLLATSSATYYLPINQGLTTASTVTPILPITLILLYLHAAKPNNKLLLLASLTTGFSLLINPFTALLSILVPSLLFILIVNIKDEKKSKKRKTKPNHTFSWTHLATKLVTLTVFLSITLLISLPSIQILLSHGVKWSIAQNCSGESCWGEYPEDLKFFSPLTLAPLLAFLSTALISFKNQGQNFRIFISLFFSSMIFFVYAILSHFKLINSLSGQLSPQYFFWTFSLLILATIAHSATLLRNYSYNRYLIASSLCIVCIAVIIPIFPETISINARDFMTESRAKPLYIENYILPKYKTNQLSEIIPDWLQTNDNNWRLESLWPNFIIWWNAYSQTPLTSGYSNLAPTVQQNWQYLLHTSLLTPITTQERTINKQLRSNRINYLLDNYAIKYLHQSTQTVLEDYAEFDPIFLQKNDQNQQIINEEAIGYSTFFELNTDNRSPIISPTNSVRALFITNDLGYDTLIRSLSLTRPKSSPIIAIKGPTSINDIKTYHIQNADLIVLYQFEGSKWNQLEKFVDSGGNIFIDIGSLEKLPSHIPEFFGTTTIQTTNHNKWNLVINPSPLSENLNASSFSPLNYDGKEWRINAPQIEDSLSPWMKPVLLQNKQPILNLGSFGDSTIIFSGLNLPFHIMQYKNVQEVKLLENIFNSLTETHSLEKNVSSYSVERSNPSQINLSFTNYRGVFFKENFHPGWKAYVNGKKTPVLKAGFGFMYIPIPASDQTKSEVKLAFQGDFLTWSLPIISITAISLVVAYIFTDRPFLALKRFIRLKISLPLKSWWTKD